MTSIEYHLSHYRAACHQLIEGCDPKDFERIYTNKDASLCVIALEVGVISEIGDGKLSQSETDRVIAWIHRYEICDREQPKEMTFAEYRLEQGNEECPCGDMDVLSCAGECGWGDAA